MSQALLLSDPVPSVSLHDGRPATTSREVAHYFRKRHDNVVRDIRSIMDNCPEEFTALNFEVSNYLDQTGRSLPISFSVTALPSWRWATQARKPCGSSSPTSKPSTAWRPNSPSATAPPCPQPRASTKPPCWNSPPKSGRPNSNTTAPSGACAAG